MYCKSPREGRPVFITSISKKMTNNFGNVEENPYLCPIKKDMPNIFKTTYLFASHHSIS